MTKLVLALLFASAGLLEGCGPPALSCQTETCSGGSKTYQLCVNIDASETWNFGGMSCHASTTDQAGVTNCNNMIVSYCGGGAGGSGGSGGGGGSGGTGGSTPCTYTVSGAQTGSGTCSAMAEYTSTSGGVGVTVTGGQSFTFGIKLMNLTTLTDGTYANADAAPGYGADYLVGTTGAYVMCSTAQNCNDAQGNSYQPGQGSFSLTITDPGPNSGAAGAALWAAPQGMLTVTMPAQPKGPLSGTVIVDVTL